MPSSILWRLLHSWKDLKRITALYSQQRCSSDVCTDDSVQRSSPLTGHLSLALSTLPAAGYLLIERGILRGNTAVMGARFEEDAFTRVVKAIDEDTNTMHSVWVFVLLGAEGIKAFRANPYFACAHSHPSLRLLQLTCIRKHRHKSDTNLDYSTPGTHFCHRTHT